MPKVKLPFIQNETPVSEFPINLFFLPNSFTGRNAMVGTPGLTARVESMTAAPVRNILVDKEQEYLYAVVGNQVYLIDSNWNSYVASTTLDTSTGHVWMSANLSQIMITDGTAGYIITRSGTTITNTKIADPEFVVPSSLVYIDGYFIVSEVDTFNYQISALNDGTSWNAADLGTAETYPDDIVAIATSHRQLLLFGPTSGEAHYNSGDSTFPFEAFRDVFIELGVGAAASIVQMDNSITYLDQDFVVRRLQSFTPVITSPPQLNQIFEAMTTKSDAICFSYSRQGNIFYVMVFPTEDITYVLNIGTGLIHQWSSGVVGGRHRANCYENFNGKDIVGDYSNGKLYSLEEDVYTDAGATIKWVYTSAPYYSENKRIFHRELEVEFKTGVGNVQGDGSDPEVALRYSDTKNQTWSSELIRSLGTIGEYKRRVRWARLGSSRNRIYELSGTDPVERTFAEAYGNIEVGRG